MAAFSFSEMHIISLSFFLFCITLIYVVSFASANRELLAQNKTDEAALMAIKSKIHHDPQGVLLKSWNNSRHFCEWEGITCGHKHRRVTILNLSSRGLYGSLSPYIGNLSFLRELILYNNSIQGKIPRDLGRLFRLKVLLLFDNSLVGEIPADLSRCSRLTDLSLGGNNLVGKIPLEFVYMYNLKLFSLHKNNLTGFIPHFLGNFTSLEIISVAYNEFGGSIPDSLGRLRKLKSLGLAGNHLSGTVPHSLYNLSILDEFSLSQNQLHGNLPLDLGLTLPNLKVFQISDNFFSGSIPVSLSNASKLKWFEIVSNNFSGKFSLGFGRMKFLEILNAGLNDIGSGEVNELSFINSLVNCSNLLVLSFWGNQLKGALPPSIANLSTTLQYLHFGRNQLYGSIPPGIFNLVDLNLLSMERNQFTGSIPKELGKLQNLKWMALHDNQLSGEIPFSLGNLSLLDGLHIYNNKLSGVIPSSLGNLKQLSFLNLFQNELTGTIPEQIFDITYLSVSLNLARNHFVGSIPPNIGKLKVLSIFDVSDNSLFGQIPNELGLCSNLEYLYMEGNFFHGSIPPSFSFLRGLREMDLSHNNLSGQIPKFFETFRLESLNLSFNDLEGEVPMKGIFANASAISVAGNGDKLCGGIAELQLPKCPNNDSTKEKVSPLFKILISTTSAIFGLTMMLCFIICWLKKRREKQASGPTLRKELLKVSYEKLLKATDGFSPTRLIGVGSFGSVYHGILDQDGTIVAVKVLNLRRQGASKSFMAECRALRNIRHRNLVRVITSCSSIDFQGNDFKAIVYEFMTNGSLEKWLHPYQETEEDQPEIQSLTLLQRISIGIDVATALDYLHHHSKEPILHCDLKPSNILLDNDMTAHVGDFGLAKFLSKVPNPDQSSSIGVRGTIGYAAPEYGIGSEVSTAGDVYSYGILLLEMMTRKRPTDTMFEGDFNLHNYARTMLPDRVMEIIDPVLVNEEIVGTNHRIMNQARNNSKQECLISLFRIGVACSMESPQDRMSITHVVHELQLVRDILLQPTTRLNVQIRGQ